MCSFRDTAPRLISSTILLLGCAPGAGGPPPRNAPAATPPYAWEVDPCVVADTSARTADTLYVIAAGPLLESGSATQVGCSAVHLPSSAQPPILVSIAVPPGTSLLELVDPPAAPGSHRPDVIVTRDAALLAWSAGRASYITAALPWRTTYVLVPARVNAPISIPTRAERDALARDAVSTDARGAAEPFTWLSDTACATTPTGPIAASRNVVAYPQGDATAQQLAERVVSLAGAGAAAPWLAAAFGDDGAAARARVAPLPADSMVHALATGRAIAAVIPIDRDPGEECFTRNGERTPAGAVPLVDARDHVVVRRGSGAAFIVTPSGALYFFRRGGP